MNRFCFHILLAFFLTGLSGLFCQASHSKTTPSTSEKSSRNSSSVCFTPGKDCTSQIVEQLNGAQKSIQMQAYSFTSRPIANALGAAQARGVKVEVILDKENFLEQFTQTKPLIQAGVAIFLDGGHQTAHNKVMIVDGKTVITGSFNFTKAAQEKNAENLLILRDPELVQAYLENWRDHQKHSEKLNPR